MYIQCNIVPVQVYIQCNIVPVQVYIQCNIVPVQVYIQCNKVPDNNFKSFFSTHNIFISLKQNGVIHVLLLYIIFPQISVWLFCATDENRAIVELCESTWDTFGDCIVFKCLLLENNNEILFIRHYDKRDDLTFTTGLAICQKKVYPS